MKRFLIQVVLFSAFLLMGMLTVFFMANGKSDAYYVRFTTPHQSSLILGTSRAAQGLQPVVFDEIIYKNKAKQFFNYSFSLIDSPYGPAYYESIKRKLDPGTRDGIFIVTVDPWSISDTAADLNNADYFIENKSFISKTKYVNHNPNLFYLVKSYNEPYINIIRKWNTTTALNLHKDGWLQVDAPMDSVQVAKSLAAKIAFYRKNYLPAYKFSELRLNYLGKTIEYLQQHGKVYLVRLPVHKMMFTIENELMPDFDDKINAIARDENIPYLNFSLIENEYQYVDGNHLYKTSGKQVSGIVAAWIAQSR